jgi:hypothetical protein
MDHLTFVAFEPPPVVFGALEALSATWGTRDAGPALGSLGFGRALMAKNVSASGWSALEAGPKQKPVITPEGSTALKRENPSYQPRLLDQPMSQHVRQASHAHVASRRERASPRRPGPGVGRLRVRHDPRHVQGHLLNALGIEAHEAVELGVIGQVRERISEVACGVTVEVPLTRESRPAGENNEGDDLTLAQRSSWASGLRFSCD